MATITFDKAQRWYPGADEPAVPGIDLEIRDGEFMVLVGPSGCGKSTLLRTLNRMHEVIPGAHVKGSITLDGTEHRLVALAGKPDGLSLHFRDATSGDSTYGGGRILRTADPAPDGTVTVDLNRTVNLPCAFTAFATCPLPPEGNVLEVAVEAGEQSPA